MDAAGPHRTAMARKVKPAAPVAYKRIRRRISSVLTEVAATLMAMYQPRGNPNTMQKIGTPIPIPTQIRSRTTKIAEAPTAFSLKNLSTGNPPAFYS
jgi:hypothetical protein